MHLARRVLDAIAIRFSKAEIRLNELRLVSAPPRSDLPIDFKFTTLHASQFNPDWFKELGIEPKVLFDVGAFHGGVAGLFRHAFPNAIVYAFEADPYHFKTCEKNAEKFGAKAINAAVADFNGKVAWYASASGGAHGSMFQRKDGITQTIGATVPSIRLDRLGISPDLVHIDVEGAEYEVLIGMGNLRPPLVYLESVSRNRWEGAKSSGEVHRLMMKLGYCLAGDFRTDRLYIHHTIL